MSHILNGVFHIFQPPLNTWPTIAVHAELRSSSDDAWVFLPPSPLAGGGAYPMEYLTAHILMVKICPGPLQTLTSAIIG